MGQRNPLCKVPFLRSSGALNAILRELSSPGRFSFGSSAGLGLLGRTLFHRLSKFGGLPGDILAGIIAASTAAGMGVAAIRWFERGERLTSDALKKLTREFTDNLLHTLPLPGKQRIGGADLKKALQTALEPMSLPQDSTQMAQPIPSQPSTAPAPPVVPLNPGQSPVPDEKVKTTQTESSSFIVDWQI